MALTFPSPPFLLTGELDADLFALPTASLPTELTIAQAARVLDMPEAGILELFKLGVLEYRQEGTQYWIDRDRLFEYKEDTERGQAWLNEMIRENQEMGLYDMEYDLEEYNAWREQYYATRHS